MMNIKPQTIRIVIIAIISLIMTLLFLSFCSTFTSNEELIGQYFFSWFNSINAWITIYSLIGVLFTGITLLYKPQKPKELFKIPNAAALIFNIYLIYWICVVGVYLIFKINKTPMPVSFAIFLGYSALLLLICLGIWWIIHKLRTKEDFED